MRSNNHIRIKFYFNMYIIFQNSKNDLNQLTMHLHDDAKLSSDTDFKVYGSTQKSLPASITGCNFGGI